MRHAQDRQHHPRQLAARGDLAQRPGRHPRVRRDHQRHLVRPARPAPVLARADLDLELGVGHRQLGQPLAHRGGERRRRLAPARRQLAGEPIELRPGLAERRLDLGQRDLDPLELLAPRPAALGVSEHVGDRTAVLALQAGEQREPLLDLLEPARRRLQPEHVRAQRGAQLRGLVAERLRALGQAGELRVDPRRAGQLRRRGGEQLGRATASVLGRDRLGSAERGAPQRLQVPQPISLDRQLRSLVLARAPRSRSRRARTRAGRARARGRQRARSRPRTAPRAPAPGRTRRRPAPAARPARARNSRRARRAGRPRASACDARAGRRTPAARSRARAGRPRSPSGRTRTPGSGRRATRAAPARSPRLRSAAPRRRRAGAAARTRPRRRPRPRRRARRRCRRGAAQAEVERLREQGLAGAGLAGHDVQPGRERQLGAIDQQQILDSQLLQHRRGVPPAPTDRAQCTRMAAPMSTADWLSITWAAPGSGCRRSASG